MTTNSQKVNFSQWQIVNMAHNRKNDLLQIKDMFQLVAMRFRFSNEEYRILTEFRHSLENLENRCGKRS